MCPHPSYTAVSPPAPHGGVETLSGWGVEHRGVGQGAERWALVAREVQWKWCNVMCGQGHASSAPSEEVSTNGRGLGSDIQGVAPSLGFGGGRGRSAAYVPRRTRARIKRIVPRR